MKRAIGLSLVLLALPAVGCKSLLKKRQPTEASATAAATTPAAPVAVSPPPAQTAATPAAPDSDVPTPEDFEDEAFAKITAQNFAVELTRLQKEIEKP